MTGCAVSDDKIQVKPSKLHTVCMQHLIIIIIIVFISSQDKKYISYVTIFE